MASKASTSKKKEKKSKYEPDWADQEEEKYAKFQI